MSNNQKSSELAGTDSPDRENSNKKIEQLEVAREDATGEALTTNTGTRIADNQNTLKAGERGPSLLEVLITSAFPNAWCMPAVRRRMAISRSMSR